MFRHLHYFLFFTFSSIFTLYSLSEADVSDFSMCSPVEYTCGGHSYNISYPFRLPQSNEHCGYPGFNLTCNGDNTTLVTNIGGREFEVIDMDYTTKQLHIIDLNFTAAEAGSCPLNFTNVTFESQLFHYSSSDANLTVYLNCSPDFVTTYTKDLVAITCLPSDLGHLSYFSLNLFPVPVLMDAWNMCDSVVYVPIYAPEESTMMKGMIGLLGALKKGFGLQWKVGDGWCDKCERTHGICGYNSSAMNGKACFCSNSAAIDGTCRENFVPPTKHKSGLM